jgi:hypothetical protein
MPDGWADGASAAERAHRLRKLEIVCAARKSAALAAQTNFIQRNRCADCAGEI